MTNIFNPLLRRT